MEDVILPDRPVQSMKQIKKKRGQISECPNIFQVFLEILNQDATIIVTKKDVILFC